MDELQVLSEYIDGELPPDLKARVERRLASDPAFRAKLDGLAGLRSRMRAGAGEPAAWSAMQARVWERLGRHAGGRSERVSFWFGSLKEAINSRIALPLPALAAMLVVVLVAGGVALGRNAGSSAAIASFDAAQPIVKQPTPLGAQALASHSLTAAGFQPDAAGASAHGMAVTIQVQNLRQLMALLENDSELRELAIQTPALQRLHLGQSDTASNIGYQAPPGNVPGEP